MKTEKLMRIASRIFILTSALTFLYVSILAFSNPQSVMDLVHVKLGNTDAYSSIRGVYGGVGLVLVVTLSYLLITDLKKGLLLLCLRSIQKHLAWILLYKNDGPRYRHKKD